MQWISVKDRLPEEYGKYLCLTKLGACVICRCLISFGEIRWSTFGSVANSITHWMPLPKAPGKENSIAENSMVNKGKWVKLSSDEFCCSNCGEVRHYYTLEGMATDKFCPSCGADMREGSRDEI